MQSSCKTNVMRHWRYLAVVQAAARAGNRKRQQRLLAAMLWAWQAVARQRVLARRHCNAKLRLKVAASLPLWLMFCRKQAAARRYSSTQLRLRAASFLGAWSKAAEASRRSRLVHRDLTVAVLQEWR